MTRFTAIALALLLVVPAKAADCPVPTIHPEYTSDLNCQSLRCFGLRLLREAYQRGEITEVHLATRDECIALSTYDVATGKTVAVPCTWDHDDFFKP